jgi:hypothetical protein
VIPEDPRLFFHILLIRSAGQVQPDSRLLEDVQEFDGSLHCEVIDGEFPSLQLPDSAVHHPRELPIEHRLVSVFMVEEIRCSIKKGAIKGEIAYKLRGDGSVKKEWDEAQKQEDPKPPSSGGSSLQVAWLREQDSNLQPCGYGILQSFRFGPDYLITLSDLRTASL